jgi:hypothetical protein
VIPESETIFLFLRMLSVIQLLPLAGIEIAERNFSLGYSVRHEDEIHSNTANNTIPE